MTEYKRLYISPFVPSQLPTILQSNLLPLIQNVSFHTIQTFPEKAYGYIELPVPEADKLKKKYHGLIFRGLKMRVEEARPERRKRGAEEEEEAVESKDGLGKRVRREKVSRSKHDDGVIDGVELPEGRKVKRGWADTDDGGSKQGQKGASRKSTKRMEHSKNAECMFKSKLPANVHPPSETKSARRKSKQSKHDEVIIQEFSKTKQLASPNSPQSRTPVATEFVEGKGWVTEDGTVVEPAPRSSRRQHQTAQAAPITKPDITVTEPAARNTRLRKGKVGVVEAEVEGDASRSSDSSSETSLDSNDEAQNPRRMASLSITRSSPSPPLAPASSSPPPPPAPHPLETLFKRPAPKASPSNTSSPQIQKTRSKPKPSLEVSTSFTFFEPDEKPEDVPASSIEGLKVPQTPFTRQDFRDRTLRSAAPTPDTAAPGKSGFGHVWGSESPSPGEGDEDADEEPLRTDTIAEEDDMDEPAVAGSEDVVKDKPAKRSEFEKWFWEHRGENNRHMKKLRREAMKGKRREANKRRAPAR